MKPLGICAEYSAQRKSPEVFFVYIVQAATCDCTSGPAFSI